MGARRAGARQRAGLATCWSARRQLSHGQKRQLEIAMCLATEPQVLLLDEPLAGMGAEETDRMLALLAELKTGHAILLVEHDMDAVFRIADRITVMVNGAVIASAARPKPCAASPRSAGRLPGWALRWRDRTDPRSQGLHAWYGSSHVLHGVDLQHRPGETVGLLGRNGMGKSTLIRTLLGHVRAARRPDHLFGRDMSRAKPHEVARLGVAYVPEGRGIFPNLSVRENLVMAARPGATAATTGPSSA
jgi:branched-chain amino acid transport system ATP-binding protein